MSEPKKYTLKNVPEVYCEDYFDNGHVSSTMQACSRDDMMKLHEWFEGFEKELRERLAILDFKLVLTESIVTEKRVLKEVLGDSE